MIALVAASSLVSAKELITLVNGTSPSQPNVATYIRTLDAANKIQDKYEFVIEMKPGANGALALKAMDQLLRLHL
jgi:hypothetical protein